MSPGYESIKHIVVLMLENRSFDNVLGTTFEPGVKRVNKFYPGNQNRLAIPIPAFPLCGRNSLSASIPPPDPGEFFQYMNQQIFGLGQLWWEHKYKIPTSRGQAEALLSTNGPIDNGSGAATIPTTATALWVFGCVVRPPLFEPLFSECRVSAKNRICSRKLTGIFRLLVPKLGLGMRIGSSTSSVKQSLTICVTKQSLVTRDISYIAHYAPDTAP